MSSRQTNTPLQHQKKFKTGGCPVAEPARSRLVTGRLEKSQPATQNIPVPSSPEMKRRNKSILDRIFGR